MNEPMLKAAAHALSSAEFFDRARARLTFDVPPALLDPSVVPSSGDAGTDRMLQILAHEQPIRPAAVLIPIVDHPEPTVLLTQRSPNLADHAGQISFPGGKIDAIDASPRDAALRGELRRELAQGTPHRELLALEPLLTEADPVAVAAAALRLLERERQLRATERPRTPTVQPVAAWSSGERPRRNDRPERQERGGDRGYRGERSDRGDRRDRGDRPERGDRGDRGYRGDRPDRGDRARPERSARSRPQPGDRRPDFRDRGPRRSDRPGPRREDR